MVPSLSHSSRKVAYRQPTQRFCNTSCQAWDNVPLLSRSRTYLQREAALPRVSAHETHTSVTTYLNDVLTVALRRSDHRDDPNWTTLRFYNFFFVISYGPCIMFRNTSWSVSCCALHSTLISTLTCYGIYPMPSSGSSIHCNFLLNTSAEWTEISEGGISRWRNTSEWKLVCNLV